MGAYLSAPRTDKESTDESNEQLSCGVSQMQGWRKSQEVSLRINSKKQTKNTKQYHAFNMGTPHTHSCSRKMSTVFV